MCVTVPPLMAIGSLKPCPPLPLTNTHDLVGLGPSDPTNFLFGLLPGLRSTGILLEGSLSWCQTPPKTQLFFLSRQEIVAEQIGHMYCRKLPPRLHLLLLKSNLSESDDVISKTAFIS